MAAKQLDSNKLVDSIEIREQYQQTLTQKLVTMKNTNPSPKWEQLHSMIKQTAEETVGYKKKIKHREVRDPTLAKMSVDQQQLRLQIETCDNVETSTQLRRKRKNVLKEMSKHAKRMRQEEMDKIVGNIEGAPDHAKMYQAVKFVNRKPLENTFVHDEKGRCVTNKQSMYTIINQHFKEHFHKENTPALERFNGPPKKLNKPLTANTIMKTTSSMKNNKATFDIPVETVKYAPPQIHGEVARVLNDIFEKHEDIHLGEGVLVPLQKPKPKPVGPVKNLRPITLTATIRKILSRSTTKRIVPKTNSYLSHSQSAYRDGRSTSDIVWSYRWIAAKVQEIEIKVYIVGIDMSSAFDTIDRQKLVDIVESFLDEDEARIIRRLLSNTTLK